VLPGEHRIKAIDFPGEDGHSFVFGGRTVQANESKEKKVRGLHQLWHHDLSIEGGEGRVVEVTVVNVLETDKPCVLDAVTLRGNGWENDSLRQLLFGLELNFVVGPGQHPNPLRLVLIFLHNSIRQAELFGSETGAKIFQRERVVEFVHDPVGEFASQSQLNEFPCERSFLIKRVWDLTRLGEEAG